MPALQPFGAMLVPPASPGKSKSTSLASPAPDAVIKELEQWYTLLLDAMGPPVEVGDMIEVINTLKKADISKPSKALGMEGSDVKDIDGFTNLTMTQRGIIRMGVAAMQHTRQLYQTTTTAAVGSVATPQGAKSTKVQDTTTASAGREANEGMVASALQLADQRTSRWPTSYSKLA